MPKRTKADGPRLPFYAPFAVPDPAVTAERDRVMDQVATHAEARRPGFGERAADFVLTYLAQHGPASSELLSEACKHAGIRPHDDRAFGPVYMRLARLKQIEKIGACRRERGHGTAGGNIWTRRQSA